ncbi:MAG: ATP-binding protein [Actinomycetota bacterium]
MSGCSHFRFRADLRLPAQAAALASARRFTESRLAQWHVPQLTDSLNLLVTELVTNAVVHGGTEAHLKLLFDSRRLRVEVRDGSSAEPRVQRYSTTATTGRGMQIVDSLADRWGTKREDVGKVVWLELDVDPRHAAGNPLVNFL